MKKLLFVLYTFITFSSFSQVTFSDSITSNGRKLIQILDSSHVEELWLKGYRVDWETGQPLAVSKNPKSTHCSAFAASIAKKMGIYLLRPPEHKSTLLANAQYDWIQTSSAEKEGWTKVNDGLTAQNEANKGNLVITIFKNPDETRPGHISIIRPAVKSIKLITKEGPQTTQAGGTNAFSIPLKHGFGNHPGAWPDGVIFYEHTIDWNSVR